MARLSSIIVVTPDSWVELTFRDGSTVTIPGRSALTISEHEQKELHLQHGRLSARVAKQPVGKPMLVYTPTAELEVVGTQFNVDAEPSATIIAVNEGLVRLTRLTDGKVVEVPAQHQTIVSIDQQDGFTLTNRTFVVKSWRADPAKDTTCGKWTSALTSLGLELKKAVASGRMTEQEAIAQYKAAANLNDEPGVLYATPWPVKHSKYLTKADVCRTWRWCRSRAARLVQSCWMQKAGCVSGANWNRAVSSFNGSILSVSDVIIKGLPCNSWSMSRGPKRFEEIALRRSDEGQAR